MAKLPVVTYTHGFTGDYEGIEAVLWLNPPSSLRDEMTSGDVERYAAAFGRIVRSWNLEREDGTPWPVPVTPADWDELPGEMLNATIEAWHKALEERTQLPKVPIGPFSNTSTTAT